MIKEGSSKKLLTVHRKNSRKSIDSEPKMREMNQVQAIQRSRRATFLSTPVILTRENRDSTTGT